jgi:hypothetical protein
MLHGTSSELPGYRTVRTCIEYRSVKSVFIVKRQTKSNLAVVYYSESDNSSAECFTECFFLVRTQKTIHWGIRFNICQVPLLWVSASCIACNNK